MAEDKEPLPNVDDEIDKLLSDFDTFDVGDIDPDSREPATPKQITIDVVKSSLTNADFIEENIIDKVLPDAIVTQKDTIKAVKNDIVDTIETEFNKVKDTAGKLVEATDRLIPDRFTKVKSVLAKIKPDTLVETIGSREETVEAKSERLVAELLESNAVLQRASYVSQLIDQVVRSDSDLTTRQLQKQQATDVSKLTQFHLTFVASYQRKSLELKYRSVLMLKDILVNLIQLTKLLDLRLKEVVKNTALPDFIKLRSSEVFKEQLRRDVASNAIRGLQSGVPLSERITRGLRRRIERFSAGIREGLEVPYQLVETAGSIGGDDVMPGGGNTKYKIAGSMGLGYVLGSLASRVRSKLEERLDKTGITDKIEAFYSDVQSNLERFAKAEENKDDGIIVKTLRHFSKIISDTMVEPSDMESFSPIRISEMSPERIRLYEIRSKLSLVEVIPGYLARMLKELVYIGRGVDTDLVVYDYNSRRFIDRSTIAKTIKKQPGIESIQSMAKDISDGDLRYQKQISAILADLSINEKSLGQYKSSNIYTNLTVRERREIDKIFDTIQKDRQTVKTVNEQLSLIRRSFSRPDDWLMDVIDRGQLDILLEQGIVTENDGKIQLNREKYLTWLFQDTSPTVGRQQYQSATKPSSPIDSNTTIVGRQQYQSATKPSSPIETVDNSTVDTKKGRIRRMLDRYVRSKYERMRRLGRLVRRFGGDRLFSIIRRGKDSYPIVQTGIQTIESNYDRFKRQLVENETVDPTDKVALLSDLDTNEKLDKLDLRFDVIAMTVDRIAKNTEPEKELRFKDELDRFRRKPKQRKEKVSVDKKPDKKKPSLLDRLIKLVGGIGSMLTKGFDMVIGRLVDLIKSVVSIGAIIKTIGSITGGLDISKRRKSGRSNIPTKSARLAGKLVGKRIPVIGAGIGAMYMADRLSDGDIVGGVGELVSGVASTIPIVGTGVSIAIDTALTVRDNKLVKDKIVDQIDAILGNDRISSSMYLRRLKNVVLYGLGNDMAIDTIRGILVDRLSDRYDVNKSVIDTIVDYIITAATMEYGQSEIHPPSEPILTMVDQILTRKIAIDSEERNTITNKIHQTLESVIGRIRSTVSQIAPTSGIVGNTNQPIPSMDGDRSYYGQRGVDYRSSTRSILQGATGSVYIEDSEPNSLDGNSSGRAETEGIVDTAKLRRIPYHPTRKIPLLTTPHETPEGGLSAVNVRNAKLHGLNPVVLRNFLAMAKEYYKLTGKKINVNSAYRSYQDQMRLSRRRGGFAAKPGRSLHEYGLAIDINTKDADELDRLGLMRKYGFIRPLSGESWHIEPVMIQFNLDKAKADPSVATRLAEESINRGGGGLGALVKRRPIRRNLSIVRDVIDPKTTLPISLDDIKSDTADNLTIPQDVDNTSITPPETTSKALIPAETPIVKAATVGKSITPSVPKQPDTKTITETLSTQTPSESNRELADAIVNFSTVSTQHLPKLSETMVSIDTTLKTSLDIQRQILQTIQQLQKTDTQQSTISEIPKSRSDKPAINLGKSRSF